MRLAAIYDIHGNLPALQAVLDEIRKEGVDQVAVGEATSFPVRCRETACRSSRTFPSRFTSSGATESRTFWRPAAAKNWSESPPLFER